MYLDIPVLSQNHLLFPIKPQTKDNYYHNVLMSLSEPKIFTHPCIWRANPEEFLQIFEAVLLPGPSFCQLCLPEGKSVGDFANP